MICTNSGPGWGLGGYVVTDLKWGEIQIRVSFRAIEHLASQDDLPRLDDSEGVMTKVEGDSVRDDEQFNELPLVNSTKELIMLQ